MNLAKNPACLFQFLFSGLVRCGPLWMPLSVPRASPQLFAIYYHATTLIKSLSILIPLLLQNAHKSAPFLVSPLQGPMSLQFHRMLVHSHPHHQDTRGYQGSYCRVETENDPSFNWGPDRVQLVWVSVAQFSLVQQGLCLHTRGAWGIWPNRLASLSDQYPRWASR